LEVRSRWGALGVEVRLVGVRGGVEQDWRRGRDEREVGWRGGRGEVEAGGFAAVSGIEWVVSREGKKQKKGPEGWVVARNLVRGSFEGVRFLKSFSLVDVAETGSSDRHPEHDLRDLINR